MQEPTEFGVYHAEITDELARVGCAYAALHVSQCEDGLFRYALDLTYSYGGFGSPNPERRTGLRNTWGCQGRRYAPSVTNLSTARPTDPQSLHEELRTLKVSIEERVREPTLF